MLNKLNLVSSHAYKVIGHGEIKDSKGKSFNLLKIKCLYKSTFWNGKWSPNSTQWTNEYKTTLKYDPDDRLESYRRTNTGELFLKFILENNQVVWFAIGMEDI